MDSDDPALLAMGALGGAAVAIGGVALFGVGAFMGQQGQQQGASMTTHNVIRDEEGRIQTVEAVEGLPMSQQQNGLAPPPAPDIPGGL